jgi:flagellar biosynthesis chaperone FliJ
MKQASQIRTLEETLRQLRKDLSASQAEKDKLEQACRDKDEMLSRLQTQYEQESTSDNAQTELASLREEHARLQQSLTQIQHELKLERGRAKMRQQHLEKEKEKAKRELEQLSSKVSEQSEAHAKQLAKLEAERDEARRALAEARASSVAHISDEAQKDQVAALMRRVEQLELELKGKRLLTQSLAISLKKTHSII